MRSILRRLLLPKIDVSVNEDTYPSIPPVPEGEPRPFWSVMIPTRNRPELLTETLNSVLAQNIDASEMQILVVDSSTDANIDIQTLVQDIGGGRIEYHRQPENTSVVDNWNACLSLSLGHWVHLLHDDDIVLPGFYSTYRQHIETTGCNVLFSQATFLHHETGEISGETRPIRVQDGLAVDPYELIWRADSFVVSTLVASRDLYEQIGGYNMQMYFTVDLELSIRLFRAGRVGFIIPPVLAYRVHLGQESRLYWRKRESIRDIIYSCAWLTHIAPSEYQAKVYTYASELARNLSLGLQAGGYSKAAWRQSVLSFRLKPSLKIGIFAGQCLIQISQINRLTQKIRDVLGKIKRRILRYLGITPYIPLTELERTRSSLANTPRYTLGCVSIYGWDLEYVDAPAMLSSLSILVEKGWNDFQHDGTDPVILDCGANIGLSVLRYKQLYPNAKIIAFEPDKDICAVLRRNLERNGAGDVEVVEAAVWTQESEMTFYAEGADGSRLVNNATNLTEEDTYSVKTVDLGAYLTPDVDFVKLDIEGAEVEVVEHIMDKLKQVSTMVIEFHHTKEHPEKLSRLISALTTAGYRFYLNSLLPWRDFNDTAYQRSRYEVADQHIIMYLWKPD